MGGKELSEAMSDDVVFIRKESEQSTVYSVSAYSTTKINYFKKKKSIYCFLLIKQIL